MLTAEQLVHNKLKDKDEAYISVGGNTNSEKWAKRMSMALAEVKDEQRKASKRNPDENGNGKIELPPEFVLPNPLKYSSPVELFYTWLEANKDWSENNIVSKASENDDPLVSACVALLGKINVLYRNYKPEYRKAV